MEHSSCVKPLSVKHKALIYFGWWLILCLQFIGRIRVHGKQNLTNIPYKNRLVLSNHPSLLDPVLLAVICFMPDALRDPQRCFPWQTPNADVMEHVRLSIVDATPLVYLKIDKDDKPSDATGLRKIIRELKEHPFIMFPEGARTHLSAEPRRFTSSGVPIGHFRNGIGFIVAHTKPWIVPILIKGADKVLPFYVSWWMSLLNIWRYPIDIIIGTPINSSEVIMEDGENNQVVSGSLSQYEDKNLHILFAARNKKESYSQINEKLREAIILLDTERENP